MESRTNNSNRNYNFWSRVFEIPAWLLLLIAIAAVLATVLRITIPAFLWALIILVLLLIGWFAQGSEATPGGRREISDPDAPQYSITFENLPDNITPSLLKIDDRDASRNLDRDGIGEVLYIAGNLVFYDNNNELVTSFSSPLRLTVNYTDEDEQRRLERQNALRKAGKLAENEEVRLIPVYLYSHSEEPVINIWKPFQNFRIDRANKTMTVEVLFWGDQQFGGGTKP